MGSTGSTMPTQPSARHTQPRIRKKKAFQLHRFSLSSLFFFALCLHHVANCGDGVIENHPRAGKAHHGADLFTHVRFVAVHAAVDAEGLRLHERAVLGAGAGVVVQRRALGTEHALLCGDCGGSRGRSSARSSSFRARAWFRYPSSAHSPVLDGVDRVGDAHGRRAVRHEHDGLARALLVQRFQDDRLV